MCFFLILGVVPREKRVGTEIRTCGREGRETMHEIVERRNWFTLFFVPLFPVGGKYVFARCTSCGAASGARADDGLHPAYHSPPGMKVCPYCGAESADRARFCQDCGYEF